MVEILGAKELARRLTPTQSAALIPFTNFSDRDGAVLKSMGLLVEQEGVWFHTDLGCAVRKACRSHDQ